METRVLLGLLAVAAGFAATYAGALIGAMALRRRNVAMAAQGDPRSLRGLISWRLRNGFAPVVPIAEALMRMPRVRAFAEEFSALLGKRGLVARPANALSVVIVAAVAMGVVVGLATGSTLGVVVFPICGIAVLATLVGNAADKRHEEMREAVPEALESMAACFGSGFTLLQTFRQVAEDVPGPLGETFSRSSHILEMGGSAERALAKLRDGAQTSELAFVAVALDVQHQSGGAMRQVLEAATDTVKGELALRRSLRVQTAQAKLSARVVVVMPFILVAAFTLASPDFLAPFFESPAGYALLAVAIVMQASGILLVRKALNVEGVA